MILIEGDEQRQPGGDPAPPLSSSQLGAFCFAPANPAQPARDNTHRQLRSTANPSVAGSVWRKRESMVRGSQRVNQTTQGYHAMQHGVARTRHRHFLERRE